VTDNSPLRTAEVGSVSPALLQVRPRAGLIDLALYDPARTWLAPAERYGRMPLVLREPWKAQNWGRQQSGAAQFCRNQLQKLLAGLFHLAKMISDRLDVPLVRNSVRPVALVHAYGLPILTY
jgi:hypothetical protein